MANVMEKSLTSTDVESSESVDHSPKSEAGGRSLKQEEWIYRPFRIGRLEIPYYASPHIQLALVALVCFLCPGMLNALIGLGGGGGVTAHDANDAAVAHYSTMASLGFFAGSVTNRIGVRTTLFLGGLGYSVYVSSFLVYSHSQNSGYLIFAGGISGFGSALLWTAQATAMMSYPPEKSKGRFISWTMGFYLVGNVVGSLIPLIQNIHSKSNQAANGTYIGLIIVTLLGALVALSLLDTQKVQRQDGSCVIATRSPSWKSEVLGLWKVLRTDTYILLLFPMFLTSAWWSPYQINDVNLAKFNIRTRTLNGTLGALSTIVSTFTFGYALDFGLVRRSMRARLGHIVLLIVTMVVWGGSYAWQKTYSRASTSSDPETSEKLDFTSPAYIGPMFLYISYGFFDAAWITTLYWFMGALTNSSRKLANFAGFFKGLQSAGAAISFRIDALDTPFMNELAICWAMCVGSLLIAGPAVWVKIKDTVNEGDGPEDATDRERIVECTTG